MIDYPGVWAYERAHCQEPGIRETVDFRHINKHYYLSQPWLDPIGIVPPGPDIEVETPP
jgi:putative glutathione S-transferase